MSKKMQKLAEAVEATRITLLDAGIRNLREFGYPDVSRESILTDYIYAQFFRSMLQETVDDRRVTDGARSVCKVFIDQIDANIAAQRAAQ